MKLRELIRHLHSIDKNHGDLEVSLVDHIEVKGRVVELHLREAECCECGGEGLL